MKKTLALLCLISLSSLQVFSQSGVGAITPQLIPQPVSLETNTGKFDLSKDTEIIYDVDSVRTLVQDFSQSIKNSTGYDLKIVKGKKGREGGIALLLNSSFDQEIGAEGYRLKVHPKGVKITANSLRGIHYGMETLRQLFPPEIESHTLMEGINWSAPAVDIVDYPKFKWRGLMLDVSRHFFTVEEIKKFIDEMAKYKYNVFHWHLTDDQGWRFAMDKYPKLKEIAAWRDGTLTRTADTYSTERYGGLYTDDEIREVVQYAAEHQIDVLPEIEMPGHSQAVVAAYPEFGCTNKKVEVRQNFGVSEDIYCPNEKTFQFLEDVIDKIADLFPFGYIHLGGDEAPKKQWKESAVAQQVIQEKGLKDEDELQSYFVERMGKYIESKGKEFIGWDEILEGGLAEGATVMSWRGVDGGIQATQLGHPAIISPYGRTYISQLQGDRLVEPFGPAMTRLRDTYKTELLPEGIEEDLVLGGQAALWTEWVPNYRHVEYMTWPRSLAAAEVFWGTTTPWEEFVPRVEAQLKRLKAADVNFATSIYDPITSAVKEGNELKVVLESEIPGTKIYYSFDGTNPDDHFPEYKGKALSIPSGSYEIRSVVYRDGNPLGKQINVPISELEKRIKKD